MTPEQHAAATDHAYLTLLDWRSPTARLILADLAAHCHVGETTLPRDADALTMARNEGKRAVFLYLAGRIGLPLIPEA